MSTVIGMDGEIIDNWALVIPLDIIYMSRQSRCCPLTHLVLIKYIHFGLSPPRSSGSGYLRFGLFSLFSIQTPWIPQDGWGWSSGFFQNQVWSTQLPLSKTYNEVLATKMDLEGPGIQSFVFAIFAKEKQTSILALIKGDKLSHSYTHWAYPFITLQSNTSIAAHWMFKCGQTCGLCSRKLQASSGPQGTPQWLLQEWHRFSGRILEIL